MISLVISNQTVQSLTFQEDIFSVFIGSYSHGDVCQSKFIEGEEFYFLAGGIFKITLGREYNLSTGLFFQHVFAISSTHFEN